MDDPMKIELLKFIHKDQRGEMEFRREREHRIFMWSSSLLVALIGTLLITKQTENIVWKTYGIWGNLIASLAVFLVVIFSIIWQRRNNKLRGRNATVVSRINKIFHCFDVGYFTNDDEMLFPKDWQIGRKTETFFSRFFFANYVTATFLLGVLAIIMIWLP